MKEIFGYLKHYFNNSTSWFHFSLAILYAAFWTYLEYSHDFTVKYLDPYDNTFQGLVRYFLFYSVVYLPLLWFGMGKQPTPQKLYKFKKGMHLLVSMLLVFSFRSSNYWLKIKIAEILSGSSDFDFYYRSLGQLIQASVLFLPIYIVWSWYNKSLYWNVQGFKYSNILPYLLLLLGMLPLLAWASFQQDFLQTYPIYIRYLKLEGVAELPYVKVLLFELAYGIDFVATEYFFRGFLIIALGSIFGRAIVLPMAVFYVTIHFGKPLGETISSFFGGLILGVIAYETKSIYGGIMIHLGIAWLMEIGGTLGRVMHMN